MKIVILDGYTLNPGDLSWEGFRELGKCSIYDRTSSAELIKRTRNAEILFTNKVELSKNIINQLPTLKYIGVLATGYNIVDISTAREKNIVVTNIPSYGTNSVAQMVFALLLELTQNAGIHSKSVFEGEWTRSEDWCYWIKPIFELAGLTMGIIGLGRIGMEVVANDVTKLGSIPSWLTMVEQDEVFRESDVVSLHCPLTSENKYFVNSTKINLMKESAYLINTSRGLLINEKDLADALNLERIAGAGLDVLSEEPPDKNNPLLSAKNCIITPHIAWATKAARQRLLAIALQNLKAFLDGKPINVVN